MSKKPHVTTWPQKHVSGAKRANASSCDSGEGSWDWFAGYGKDESCQFEGTWWDMICFARNVLASENTRLGAPEFHMPEWRVEHYTEPGPYTYGKPEPKE